MIPFFMTLGWDVNNEKGYAEVYKEVIHEDAIKVGVRVTKRCRLVPPFILVS